MYEWHLIVAGLSKSASGQPWTPHWAAPTYLLFSEKLQNFQMLEQVTILLCQEQKPSKPYMIKKSLKCE